MNWQRTLRRGEAGEATRFRGRFPRRDDKRQDWTFHVGCRSELPAGVRIAASFLTFVKLWHVLKDPAFTCFMMTLKSDIITTKMVIRI